MTCGIYRITEKETGRHYIGQSRNIENRWKTHHKRFSPELFSYHIVITCVPEDEVLDCLEKFCIADFKAKMLGFNVTKGGNGAWGSKNPEETRRKKSENGKNISDETRRKLSEAMKGNKRAAGNKGKPFTEERKKKLSMKARLRASVTCPHCGLSSQNKTCMQRWHFDSCKRKEE